MWFPSTGQRRSATARRVLPLLAAIAVPAAASAEPFDSIYSSFDWQDDCIVTDEPTAPEEIWVKLACPGPGPYSIFISDDDQRMSLDYGRAAPDRGGWESFTSFNHVHTTVEWRRHETAAGMEPFAAIHRWFVQGQGQDAREVLVVSTVSQFSKEQSCMVGFVDANANPDANEMARQIADQHAETFDCTQSEPQFYGQTTQHTPQPSLPAPSNDSQAGEPPGAVRIPPALPFMRRYWDALGNADTIAETQRFRMPDKMAHIRADYLASGNTPREAYLWLTYRQFLADTYRIGNVEVLDSPTGMRHLRVGLVARVDGSNARPQTGDVRLMLDGDQWKIATVEWNVSPAPHPAPWVMIQSYWHDIRRANNVRSLSAYRGENSPADHILDGTQARQEAGSDQWFEKMLRLGGEYRISNMSVMIASDAEQRLALELSPRGNPHGEPLWGEAGIVRTEQGWKIATEAWGLSERPSM